MVAILKDRQTCLIQFLIQNLQGDSISYTLTIKTVHRTKVNLKIKLFFYFCSLHLVNPDFILKMQTYYYNVKLTTCKHIIIM